ncbi:leucyl/phenylalanyl-tRNA--protein transferase [Mucilaginibacter arboris]|uniref:Leucyl/phenylalanyl-tRNA--protein transferase n=1 Tax=Mucilaginibacter arboris TaxID=2682090 RepID=A0A7K1SS97_9SPHI|nr:leucyl/phenylalanyl-tRNA--protein transferase [Mucilaginibacter arboris]MVN20183.1 leucyl/phenylalanyl-tRNA--protein transferase [Mucilaginibacter arboris]
MIFQLDKKPVFPDPELAEPDGLLAIGGDLSVERLQNAYAQGIFPWYSNKQPILWYSPNERFVLYPYKLKISKSMRKVLRSGQFKVTFNLDFAAVIRACARVVRDGQRGTWITNDMEKAYLKLHNIGKAHSIEVWEKEELVGGLYGVEVNRIFCGESMFSKVSNASKAALIALCQQKEYELIDCQMYTEHLESLGAEMISRKKYQKFLV